MSPANTHTLSYNKCGGEMNYGGAICCFSVRTMAALAGGLRSPGCCVSIFQLG